MDATVGLALGIAGLTFVLCVIAGGDALLQRVQRRWRRRGMPVAQWQVCRALDLMGVEFDRVEWAWPHE